MTDYAPMLANTPDRKSARSRLGRIAPVVAGVLAFLAIAWLIVNLLVSKPLKISKETTYITKPLKVVPMTCSMNEPTRPGRSTIFR